MENQHDWENLVLEHLRHIRGRVDLIADDIKEVKLRLSTLESSLSLVRREIIIGDETGARQQASIDRIVDRLERIEHRLEEIAPVGEQAGPIVNHRRIMSRVASVMGIATLNPSTRAERAPLRRAFRVCEKTVASIPERQEPRSERRDISTR